MSTINKREETGGSRPRVSRWFKILGLFTLALLLTLGALSIAGKFLTSRLETEEDPRALAPWGPDTSFLSTNSGDVHILDVGEGDVILLIHGSTGSIADWQESVVERLSESYRVVAFDSYGFGLSERSNSLEYGYDLWMEQAIEVLDALEIERAAYLAFLRSQYSIAFLRNYMFSSLYEDIEVPVLQMHGALDQSQAIDSARKLSARLADTRFVAIEGSDHYIHIDAPDLWVEEVT